MAEILLKCGTPVSVDEEDIPRLQGFTWRMDKHGYAYRKSSIGGVKGKYILMHRVIAGADVDDLIDHADNNRLNNCRQNLRVASKSQNRQNSLKQPGTASKHKGVTWNKKSGKWQVTIRIPKRTLYLGLFDDEDEAGHTYNKAAVLHFGEFACLNPIGKDKEVLTHD